MRKNEIGIFEIEDLEGKFHGKLEWGGELSGRLTISSTRCLPLTTYEEKLQRRWIHGVLANGGQVMLPDANCLSTTRAGGSDEIYGAIFAARYVFVGDLSFEKGPLQFHAIHLRLKWLQPWLNNEGQFHSFPPKIEELQNLLAFTIEDGGESFEIVMVPSIQYNVQGLLHQTEATTKLYIIPRELKEFEWYIAKTNSLWLLLSFISGQESEVVNWTGVIIRDSFVDYEGLEIDLELPEEIRTRLYKVINELQLNHEVKLSMVQKVYSGQEDYVSKLLTRQAESPAIGQIVQLWFAKNAEFQRVVALILAATRQDDFYLESRLTLLTQAAEALHRTLNPDLTKVLSKHKYKQLTQEFRAWVSEKVDENVAAELSGRFGNLNAISFQTRLSQLFAPLWESYIKEHSTSADLAEFVKTVATVRNNLAHANATAGDEFSEQRYLKNLLSQILRILLLSELGWTKEEAVCAVRQQDLSADLQFHLSGKGKK